MPPLYPCAPPPTSCTRVPVPLSLNDFADPYFPTLLALDTYLSVTLDALAPVFALDPYIPDKPKALSPVIALGLALAAFDSNIPVPVHISLPLGLTHDPLGPAITSPATPVPTLSAPSNPGPAAAPTALAPSGPAQRVATP